LRTKKFPLVNLHNKPVAQDNKPSNPPGTRAAPKPKPGFTHQAELEKRNRAITEINANSKLQLFHLATTCALVASP